MYWLKFAAILLLLFITELIYFRVADYFNIIDKPNHRSSHRDVTIRGGGVIFPLALLLCSLFFDMSSLWFLTGLLLISITSFIDDIKSVSSIVRFLVHMISVSFILLELHLFQLPFYWIILVLIFFIGTINAINFMDGINGITGFYGLITLGTLYYINSTVHFTDSSILLVAILSVIVFNFFNFRLKAQCFAGDVGSVSLAFIIVFFILQLIIKTESIGYVLLLLVYGLDTGTTIVFRLIRKEKILEAHRSHFYQFWANEKRMSHLKVAFFYGIIQLLINLMVVSWHLNSAIVTLVIASVSMIVFVTIRFYFEGKVRLLKTAI